MKRISWLTGIWLATGAPAAGAQGTIALAYNECRTQATTANDFTWPNSTPDPCTDPANAGSSATIVPSWKNTNAIPNFLQVTCVIDIQVAGTRLSDFWMLDRGGCHEDGISAGGAIGTDGTLPPNCGNPFGLALTQLSDWGWWANPEMGRVHFETDHSRLPGAATVNPPVAAGGYAGSIISLSWNDAASDGSSCAGCTDPACIVLNEILVYNRFNTLVADLTDVAPGVQNFVTLYGGTANCPGAVPTKNATWGSVKALYR